MDFLGHIIDDRGIHANSDKMVRIRKWQTPRNKHDVQQFLGLVQYLAHFMPDVSAYTDPLAAIQNNRHPFHWGPMHQMCMDNIKLLACKTPMLRPIDTTVNEPTRFMSKKFTAAQHNYWVFEMETIAILEALIKW